jgi:hypothetical protein
MAAAEHLTQGLTPTPADTKDVATSVSANPMLRSEASGLMLPRIELMRACYGGTETMRQMDRLFLPQYPRETDTRYVERLRSTFCLNKLRSAVDSASAKPFRNLVTVEGGDDQLQDWMWDADMRKHHIHIVGHKFFNEAVLTSMGHILVDSTMTDTVASLGMQRAMGVRPFMRLVKTDDLLAFYEEQIDGETRVVHARIATTRSAYDPATFREITYDRVYVIEREVVQVWERQRLTVAGSSINAATLGNGGSIYTTRPFQLKYLQVPSAGGAWTLVSETRVDLRQVPLVTMVAGDEECPGLARPIFEDLAYKQIEHWQSSSDQRNILSAGRFAMLAASGINLDDDGPDGQGFEIGPWKILTSPDPQGRWYYVEPQGKAIEAGQKDIEALELQMDMLSLNPTVGTHRQYISQNEHSLQENRVNSVIHDLAISCQAALKQAIVFMGDYVGRDYSDVKVDLNYDFSGTDERAKNVNSVLMAASYGVLSREGALRELKRLDLLDAEFDIDAELTRVAGKITSGKLVEQPPNEDPTEVVPFSKASRDIGGDRPANQA